MGEEPLGVANHLGGCALDVFPEEPEHNTKTYPAPLKGVENVILTPHVGGSTEEAQFAIAEDVASKIIRFINNGSTLRSVNFPNVDVTPTAERHRILNVHKNVPGVLREINRIISDLGANIEAQTLATDSDIGYLILETDRSLSLEVKNAIEGLKQSIKTRILY